MAKGQYHHLKFAYSDVAEFFDKYVLYSLNCEGVEQHKRKRHFLDLFN